MARDDLRVVVHGEDRRAGHAGHLGGGSYGVRKCLRGRQPSRSGAGTGTMGVAEEVRVDETYAAYLDQVRAQRAELGESMAALDGGAGPAGRPRPDVAGRVRAALTELAHDLRDHVELTEKSGGFYDDILAKAPRLSREVEEQKAEHAALLAEVERLLAERDEGMPGADAVAPTARRRPRLVGALVRHRQRGSDLTYEAYAVDIGGSMG